MHLLIFALKLGLICKTCQLWSGSTSCCILPGWFHCGAAKAAQTLEKSRNEESKIMPDRCETDRTDRQVSFHCQPRIKRLTCLKVPAVNNIRPAAHSGTMRTEESVIIHPRVYAQSGYTYQSLNFRCL